MITTTLLLPILTIALAPSGPPPLLPPTPDGWRLERLPFPLEFAPDLGLEGYEDLRFAPGMFEPGSDSYFSYILGLRIENDVTIDLAFVRNFLDAYYRGLVSAVAEGRGLDLDMSEFSIQVEEGDEPNYLAAIRMHEPFVTGELITLRVELDAHEGEDVIEVFGAASPLEKDQPIWTTLHDLSSAWRAARAPSIVDRMQSDAETLSAMVESDAVRAVLAATAHLPLIEPRTVYRAADGRTLSRAAHGALDQADQATFEPVTLDPTFYYDTKYGNPLVYARPLDLAAARLARSTFEGMRILDFGYGTVGHLRLLAECGADVVGVDVDPLLTALYSEPMDQGALGSGRVTLVSGRFPVDDDVRREVGTGFDLIISKNTLKRGYITPERAVDPKRLVHLGVEPDDFAEALFHTLRPGGLVMIYNLAPAQNPPDQPYIPWADGRCPFAREVLEAIGFEVIEYDTPDAEAAHRFFRALHLAGDITDAELRETLFAHFTFLQRPK